MTTPFTYELGCSNAKLDLVSAFCLVLHIVIPNHAIFTSKPNYFNQQNQIIAIINLIVSVITVPSLLFNYFLLLGFGIIQLTLGMFILLISRVNALQYPLL